MTYRVHVRVMPRTGLLDPQGQAIEGSLRSLGFDGVASVRQGKVFDLVLEGTDEESARSQLNSICEKLLANTVIENYSVEITN